MKKNVKKRFRNRIFRTIDKFFNIFTYCSRQSTSYIIENSPYSNLFLMSTPVLIRSNMYLSPIRIDYNHSKLSYYPTSLISIDQCNYSDPLMPQIALVDSEFSNHINDNRICQKEPVSSSSSSSSASSLSTSKCQSSSTIHQCYSTSTIPSATKANIEMFNNSNDIIENSSSSLPPPPPQTATTLQTSSRLSYIIRPSTPCVFGTEYYDDEQIDDDEFFVTAGGIIHSCPNIYELSIDNPRKLQSCDHLMFINQQTTIINDDNNNDKNNLNCYDTELDRYSILPRFHPLSSSSVSISTESINSELELYKERHAIGLSRQYHDTSSTYSSFLPTTWKSDNYLLVMPFIRNDHHHHHQNSSVSNTIDHGKRSRSYDMPFGQIYPSIVA